MSKLITDAIELADGTNLSLPTARPDNTILKTSGNSLVFEDLPDKAFKDVWDFREDGAAAFYYNFETSPELLAGVCIEVENFMSSNFNNRPLVQLLNSARSNAVPSVSNYTSSYSHGVDFVYNSSHAESYIPLLPSSLTNINETIPASSYEPKLQQSGQAFLLFNGKQSNMNQGQGNVVWQHFGWGMGRRFNAPQGVYKSHCAFCRYEFGSSTTIANHVATDLTELLIYVNNAESGKIRILEIPRADS